MKSVPLTAYARSVTGRNAVRKLRGAGRIPTVIYGRNRAAQTLELNQRELDKLISHSASENILVDLSVEGDSQSQRLALVQDVQHDPMTGVVLHIDFHEVAADEKVSVLVPVEAVGTPVGVKDGGVLEYVLHKVRVRALPADLPLVLSIDVSAMGLGTSLHLGELPLPSGVEILGEKKAPVLAVAAPRAEVEATAADGAAPAAEVEMIKEKKEDAGAADGKKADAGKKDKK
jgi:large subunit ribosomal protein L25